MRGSNFLEAANEIVDYVIRFFIANFYWFLLNIPVWFVVWNFLYNPVKIGVLYYVLAFLLFTTLLFFPSTVALFATVRDWILKRPQRSTTKSFFNYMKINFSKSFKAGILFTVIWLIWVGDFYYFRNTSTFFSIVIIAVGAVLLVVTIHFLSLTVHLELNLKSLLKNAFLITIGKPLTYLLTLLVTTLFGYVGVFKIWFLFPLFTGSLTAYFSFLIFYQMYKKITS
ncbi:YesL family protein [Bacillus kwashiorkori]|uniref:YesL family protein n=1 Tax=Bacillus kwashiorkori TaxID=1522318 RepID=UPI000781C7B2|nr:DUF624 domain-containing protein [Bacillus kwashiorkori]